MAAEASARQARAESRVAWRTDSESRWRKDDSIWYLVEAPTIADERRPPVHANSETLRGRRPRDDERGAELPGACVRPGAPARRIARPRSRMRHRHDDDAAARARAARRLHRAEPELRDAGARSAGRQRSRRDPRRSPRGVQSRGAAAAEVRHRRVRQRTRAHRRRRSRARALQGRRGRHRRAGAHLRAGDSGALQPARRSTGPPQALQQALASRRVRSGRPRRRGSDIHEPDWPARLDVQPLHLGQHGAHVVAGAAVRSAGGAVGAADRTADLAADRPVALRRRPRARPGRMSQPVPRDPLLSVVMPVYNERSTVETIIRRVLAVPMRIQLIVVDDVSTDGTTEILERLEQELGFTLLKQPRNGGKGSALRRGFDAVAGDLMIVQDADLEYHPEEYPLLTNLITSGRADVVYGSRFLGTHRVFLLTHYLGNRLLTFITNVLYNTMLTDMETCYKVMRIEVLRSMELKSNGFGIEPELTAKIFKRRYKVYEVPISYDGRGYDEGKKITWRDGVVALWVLLKYRFSE